jgi:hypothetical protein
MAPHGFGGISLETRQQGREEFYQMEKPHLHTTPVLVPSDKNLPGTNRPSPPESTPPTSQLPHRILSDEMGHADAPGITPHLVVAPLFCAPQRDTRRSLPTWYHLGILSGRIPKTLARTRRHRRNIRMKKLVAGAQWCVAKTEQRMPWRPVNSDKIHKNRRIVFDADACEEMIKMHSGPADSAKGFRSESSAKSRHCSGTQKITASRQLFDHL